VSGRPWRRLIRVPRPVARQAREDVDAEIAFHLDMRTDELVAAGLEPDEARARAEREFGSSERARRRLEPGAARRERRRRLGRLLEELRADVRYAMRGLTGSPGFAAVSVLTLGLAIGANAAIFSVADAVLFRPLPYAEPDRLVAVWEHQLGESERNHISSATLIDWVSEQTTMSVFGAYSFPLGQALAGEGEAQEVQVLWMTPTAFQALGVTPVLGRLFTGEEGVPGAPRVAVLSFRLWRDRYGRDPDVVGGTINLDDVDYTVVGVMGPEFDFPHLGIDVWLGLRFARTSDGQPRASHQWRAIGRLAPGVTAERADAELDAISARLELEHPAEMEDWRANVEPFRASLTSDVRPLVGVLLGVVAIVLLVACANLANLFLARHAARSRELAVRSALGAGRGRLVRQLAAESGLIALAGAGVGLLLAVGGMRALVALAPADIPLLDGVRLDRPVLAFAMGTTVLAILLFGLLPASRAARTDPMDALAEGGVRTAGGTAQRRLRSAILVAQVALSLVLLFGAGLLTRSLIRLQRVDYGFEPDGLAVAWTRLPTSRYPTIVEQNAFYEPLLERVAGLPGVRSVAGTSEPPVIGYQMTFGFAVEGRPTSANDRMYAARDVRAVTPGYFETMRIALRAGRAFAETDRADAPWVAVLGESLAQEVWRGGDPIGERISFRGPEGPWYEVVGVVADVRHRSPREALPAIYIPWEQRSWPWMSWLALVVRTDGDPRALVRPIEEAVWALDGRIPIPLDTPVASLYARSRAQSRFATALLVSFAALALLLGAIGLYGLLSYTVSQRRQEIGIRVALGAGKGRIARWVLWDGLRLCAVGIAIGLAASLGLARFLDSLLFGVSARDLPTLGSVAGLLLSVAVVAAWRPAHRAARTPPASVLREG